MSDLYKPLESHFNIMMLNRPREFSDTITLPKPVVSNISLWMESEDDDDPIKVSIMRDILALH